ncbi:MAG: hypothetical protein P8Y23_18985 [Candidatus Lokiarchaeota archaeon]
MHLAELPGFRLHELLSSIIISCRPGQARDGAPVRLVVRAL